MPKCWAAQPSHTTNGTNSIPWSAQEIGFQSWADIGESPRKRRCLAEDQVTERTIALIAFNPEFLQRSTSHRWHIRLRTDTGQGTGCKFPTRQPSCHYLLYSLPASASSLDHFIQPSSWWLDGSTWECFSLSRICTHSLSRVILVNCIHCFALENLGSVALHVIDISASKTHWHHHSYLKRVCSAAFYNRAAFPWANWYTRQKNSWVQMAKTGFNLVLTHVHCKNRWKLIKLMEALQ